MQIYLYCYQNAIRMQYKNRLHFLYTMKLCNQIQCEIIFFGRKYDLFFPSSGRLTHLAVIHLGLHHPFHVLFLHGGGHTEAVAHAQDFRPAIWVRHLHWAVQNHRPRVQLQQRYNDKLTVRQRRTYRLFFNVALQFKSLSVCIINICGEIQNLCTGT